MAYMTPQEFILQKSKSHAHSTESIKQWINDYMINKISDVEMSAWLMAVYLNGLTHKETVDLTLAMVESGKSLNWDQEIRQGHLLVDKHSSGGVGDKTTLIAAPIVASLGIPVVKLSGRGLGHTGGTIDKLESIDGFNCHLSLIDIRKQLKDIGMYIGAQTIDLAPADGRIYSLRNTTSTIDSIPLIASSIASKKIASGADAFVFDIKVGQGAFMKTYHEAESLAITLKNIMTNANKKVRILLTNMDAPLGYGIGNLIEIAEVIKILEGRYNNSDLTKLSIELAAEMVALARNEPNPDYSSLRCLCQQQLLNGEALKKFQSMVDHQGGNLIKAQSRKSRQIYYYRSRKKGYLNNIDAKIIGHVSKLMGAGSIEGADIDGASGIVLRKHLGHLIESDDVIAEIHYEENRKVFLEDAIEFLNKAIVINQRPKIEKKLILNKI